MKHVSEIDGGRAYSVQAEELAESITSTPELSVSVLTGGIDRPYVYGLTKALSSVGIAVEIIGSDELDEPDIRNQPRVSFLNLRGDQRPNANLIAKTYRILAYYLRLICHAAIAKPRIFHILWNNKIESFDRTLLMVYYKALGKTVVITAHNINKRKRDSTDSFLNRLTLRIQYRLAGHIFVHTPKMKDELIEEFGVTADRISVIPFGINNSVPTTHLAAREARERLGIHANQKAILFFGRIKPYKGLEYLTAAFQLLAGRRDDYRLVIAGPLEPSCEKYWEAIWTQIHEHVKRGRVIPRIEFIAETDVEVYFKACDVLVLPYKRIFQSGVIFLGYSFGLPTLVADVGSLKDEIVEGKTGLVFKTEDPEDLARAIEEYFASDLFANLDSRRHEIREYAMQHHSWHVVGQITADRYSGLLGPGAPKRKSNSESKTAPLNVKVSD